MNKHERAKYFGELWPAACLANEWDIKDDARRRAVIAQCMREVRGPDTDSSSMLGTDEITALFVYLLHVADPSSLEKAADWVSCKDDYQTFNRARQADWHERALYGSKPNKLDQQRFRGVTTAVGGPLESLDADEVRKRHVTFASRHQRKMRRDRSAGQAGQTAPESRVPAKPATAAAAEMPF